MARGPGWWAEAATAGGTASYSCGTGWSDERRLPCRPRSGTGRTGLGRRQWVASGAVAPTRLSRELTGWPSGLTPAPYPVAPASEPVLAADPSPWDALPRALSSLFSESGARRGPASARGRGDNVLGVNPPGAQTAWPGAVGLSLRRHPGPHRCPSSAPTLSGGRKAVVLDSNSGGTLLRPRTPEDWTGKEKGETGSRRICGQGNPGRGFLTKWRET